LKRRRKLGYVIDAKIAIPIMKTVFLPILSANIPPIKQKITEAIAPID
jgi:hypothetical protein